MGRIFGTLWSSVPEIYRIRLINGMTTEMLRNVVFQQHPINSPNNQ